MEQMVQQQWLPYNINRELKLEEYEDIVRFINVHERTGEIIQSGHLSFFNQHHVTMSPRGPPTTNHGSLAYAFLKLKFHDPVW